MGGAIPPPPAGFKLDAPPPPAGYKIDSPGDPGIPNIPPSASQVADSATKTIGKIIPRIGTQVGGAEGGALLGGALGGPLGAVAGAAIGGGIGNVAGKNLPPEIGGSPDESTLHAFGWGAGPEFIARGIAGAVESRVAKRGANEAYDAIIDALDKGANPAPAEQAGRTAEALGRTTLESAKPLIGEALSDATNSLRDDIRGPITAMRRKLGEPIGDAYKALKEDPTPLDPKQISDIQEASQNVREEMLSPYPKAKAILQRIKNLSPPEAPDWMQPGYKGDHPPRPVGPEDFEAVQKYLDAKKAYKPPTWDDIRELRQANNGILRNAQGGDIHATAGLQQALDEQLMTKLPAGISRDRELYRSFMNRFPWRDATRLDRMGTPGELADYAFGGTPERAAEIAEGSSPQGKQALKEAFTDRVLRNVNPDAPLADQVKAVRDAMAPHIKSGLAASLYGAKNADELRNIFYLPEHMQQWKQAVGTDEFREAAVKEMTDAIKHPKTADAVEKGWNKVVQSLPAKTRAMLEQPTLPGAQMPVVMGTEEALAGGAKPGASNIGGRIARRAELTVPMTAGRVVASGNPLFAAGQVATMATIMGTSAGYRALMENGGANMVGKLYGSASGKASVRALLETLGAIGTQTERTATSDQNQ